MNALLSRKADVNKVDATMSDDCLTRELSNHAFILFNKL